MTHAEEEHLLFAALQELAPELDARVATTVGKLGRAEFVEATAQVSSPLSLPHLRRMSLSGALVPALLISAAVTRTAETLAVSEQIFVHAEEPSPPK